MKNKSLCVLLTILWLVGCAEQQEIEPADYPRIQTLKVTDISENGVVFNAKVVEQGNETIVNHGFIWGTFDSQKSISMGQLNTKTFSSPIDFGLPANRELQVRSFVITPSDTVIANPVTFISLGGNAPIIDSFEPMEGIEGDTITINGSNFDDDANNILVFFGNIPSTIVSTSFERLEVVVPSSMTFAEVQASIRVSIEDKSDTSQHKFTFTSPWVRIQTPETIFSVVGHLEFDGKGHIFQPSTTSNHTKIWEFEPEQEGWTLLKTFTDFFDKTGNIIQVGGKLTLFAETTTEINGTVNGFYDLYDPATQELSRHHLPILEYPGGVSKMAFGLNNDIYIGLGLDYDTNGVLSDTQTLSFKRFNLDTQNSSEIIPFPGTISVNPTSFATSEFGYVGLGLGMTDIWRYDPTTNSWAEAASFPLKYRGRFESIVVKDRIFAIMQPSTSTGTEVWELVGNTSWHKVNSDISDKPDFLKPFAIGDKLYLPIQFANEPTELYALDINKL